MCEVKCYSARMVIFVSKKRLGKIEREVLESITGGDLLVGFLCSSRSSRHMNKIAYERALTRYRTRKAIDSLVTKGFAAQDGEMLSITMEGRDALESAVQKNRTSLQRKTWDGKWRIVAYDIPAPLSKLRDQVRYILKRAGFMKLQHSVWVFPHDCTHLTELIKADRRLKSCMLYGVFDSMEDDKRLRTLFNVNS